MISKSFSFQPAVRLEESLMLSSRGFRLKKTIL
jgi:hypothetical protein